MAMKGHRWGSLWPEQGLRGWAERGRLPGDWAPLVAFPEKYGIIPDSLHELRWDSGPCLSKPRMWGTGWRPGVGWR